MSSRSLRLTFLVATAALSFSSAAGKPTIHVAPPTEADWASLNATVGGRLFPGVPYASPCFTQPFNSTECLAVRAGYLDEGALSNSPGGYIQSQWGTCQTTGDQCLLNYLNLSDVGPTLPPYQCKIGSVPQHFIDVRTPQDVATGFSFAKTHQVTLVIKNTGHDYKGRSSAPNSLALWTHNLKDISFNPTFTPEGCSGSQPGVTVGAGAQWGEVYAFAEAHNITVVGGSDKTVGASGGWLQGGGHSVLSPLLGLGVDRVLQFKVVTPDGKYLTANKCQNEDLFFALRGGGGGTFGVVLESTMLASPQVQVQTVIVTFDRGNSTLDKQLWTLLVDNGLKWGDEGWGGFSTSGLVLYVNPKLTAEQAKASMAPLIEFGQKLVDEGVPGAHVVVTSFPSWGSFFNFFTEDHVALVGNNLALSSRLISKENFKTSSERSTLVSGLLAAEAATPGLIILITAPAGFRHSEGTSVTEAWRNSLYHITVVSTWNWNATIEEKRGHYKAASDSINNLRRITPDAAYVNEADVYEPNYEVSFWGTNYERLSKIKQKYDPDQLLDCWQCVGSKRDASRFACYL